MIDLEHFRINPAWPKSKEDTWVELFERFDENKNNKYLTRRIPLWLYAVAGLLLPIIFVCCFYTKTVNTPRGGQTVVQLPDRSAVTLNAESKLSYKPFVWMIARTNNTSAGLFSSWTISRNVRLAKW